MYPCLQAEVHRGVRVLLCWLLRTKAMVIWNKSLYVDDRKIGEYYYCRNVMICECESLLLLSRMIDRPLFWASRSNKEVYRES
jgi:hypothetical protein